MVAYSVDHGVAPQNRPKGLARSRLAPITLTTSDMRFDFYQSGAQDNPVPREERVCAIHSCV